MLYLIFPLPNTVDTEAFAVDMRSFEDFVANEKKDGKSVDQLTLSQVECADGETRNLTLSWDIWADSILPCSQRMRSLYFNTNISGKARESKIRCIKDELPELWSRITFWVADCGESDALERLEMLGEDDVPPFMSPFYSIKKEAIYLGSLSLQTTHSLGDALRTKTSTQTYAAHDLKPFLEQAFYLPEGFHRDQQFRLKKKAWISKCRAELREDLGLGDKDDSGEENSPSNA